MADNETFLIPIDHKDFKKGTPDMDLLFNIINGRQNKILDYEYKDFEEAYEQV
jgi:hypothetical protein